MYYEINVVLNGKHFFATSERSITTKDKLLETMKVFKRKFPEREGYSIMTFYNPQVEYFVSIDTKLNTVKTELDEKEKH